MFVYTATYKDFNGTERTEPFYFHYSEAELVEMQLSKEGDFSTRVKRLVEANDQPSVIQIVKKFILDAYGVKSEDGRRFMKDDNIRRSLEECPVYSELFMKMAKDSAFAAEFINNVVPEDMKGKFALPDAK